MIACAVTLPPNLNGHRLILTPWTALVRQLIEDVDSRFWRRIGTARPASLPPVQRLPSSSQIEKLARINEPRVFITTIAAIAVLAERRDDTAALFKGFDLVLVDEGHYEPAHRWSQAIRGLARPTVLLSATPYRNDEKYFLIGDARYRFSHHEAVRQRFLRTPRFQQITRSSPREFARALVAKTDTAFPGEEPPRVIVRCADRGAIGAVVGALVEEGRSAIGIHERHAPGSERLLRRVPSPEQTDAQFWVHQNKLIEGIDDPRFKVLAFYDPLRNDRAVVQQIGRVLRNPGRARGAYALVIGTGERDPEETWGSYTNFDGQTVAESSATMAELSERILDVQPEAFYYNGAYRTRVDLNADGVWQDFVFALRTRVFASAPGHDTPTLAQLAAACADQWRDLERVVFRSQQPRPDTVIVPYITAENSPLLRRGTFIEPQFGFTVISRKHNLLFVYDTRGATPKIVLERFRSATPPELSALFPADSARLTSVALLNTDLGRASVRSRRMRALAIGALAPELSDHAYVCTTAEGHVEAEQFRRYVGLSRSRVVDHRIGERDFADYDTWLTGLAERLRAAPRPTEIFDRYARQAPVPERTEAVHVLLDLDTSAFARSDGQRVVPLELNETAVTVSEEELTITANEETHAARLAWDGLRGRYELQAASLSALGFYERDGERRELVEHINAEQALRVIPQARRQVYSHGSFYEALVPLRRRGAFQLLDLLVAVEELASAGSEKGRRIVGGDWEADSIFGMISALAPGPRVAPAAISELLGTPELLVCTDMGAELADFIYTEPRRVIFMHAKSSKPGRTLSASAFHDVTSQAVKNLLYLHPLSEEQPKAKNWMSPWRAASVSGSATRQRVGAFQSHAEIWSHVRESIADPRCEREVWLLLGRSLSREALAEQSRRRPPVAEALQLFALLQSTWGTVSQLGARLRIFCSP